MAITPRDDPRRPSRRQDMNPLAGAGKSVRIALIGLFALQARTSVAWGYDYLVNNLNNSGPGTLRQAILDANANAGADGVVFQYGLSGTITLIGELAITDSLTIRGPGALVLAVSGNNANRVFNVSGGVLAIFEDLTLRNGLSPGGTGSYGGGVYSNGGFLVFRRCTLSQNAVVGVTAAYGGGVFVSNGSVDFDGCALIGNTLNANTFASGPAAHVQGGSMTMFNCTLSGNGATAGTVSYGPISGNNATVDFEHVTVVGNSSSSVFPAGISVAGTLTSRNSLFAANGGGNFDTDGTRISLGYNLVSDGSSGWINGQNGDIIGVDPMVGTLGQYGGPTPTLPLLPGSPAIDSGDLEYVLETDQRGYPRMIDGKCSNAAAPDIGAFEYGSGGGLRMDGLNDYVAVPYSPSLNLANNFTLEAWVDMQADSSTATRIVSNRTNANTGFGFGQFNGFLHFTTFGQQDYFGNNSRLTPGVRTHVAVVFNAANDAFFYINGELTDIVPGATPATLVPPGAFLALGVNPIGDPQRWNGTIDDVRIWNVARTSAQIQFSYLQPLTGNEPGLVALWRFDEGQGAYSLDMTGEHHGNNFNSPYWMEPACPCNACDTNCDGAVDGRDVRGFIEARMGIIGCSPCSGDVNVDGQISHPDLQAFVNCLMNGV